MTVATGHRLILLLPLLVAGGFWIVSTIERRAGGSLRPGFIRRNGPLVAGYLVIAVALWAVVIIVLPQLFMVELSFRPKLPPLQVGGPNDVYTWQNYHYFLFGSISDSSQWNSVHLRAFLNTIVASALLTALSFAICYPLAYYLAHAAPPARVRLVLLMLITPYWVNELLRAFAFRIIFATSGVLNHFLQWAGLVRDPIDFLGNDVALYAGLSYAYLLLMIFALYNALESLEQAQIEAARDLGAPWWHIHLFVVMPFAKPGIASGCTLVFMLTAGALAAPLVLGGPRSLWFTPIVYDRFYQAFNWPQGAAYALILLLGCMTVVLLVLRAFRVNLGEIAK